MFRCLGFLLLENDCQPSFSFQLSSLLKQRHSCHCKRYSAVWTVTRSERSHTFPSRACTYPPAGLAACRPLSEASVLGYMLLQSFLAGWCSALCCADIAVPCYCRQQASGWEMLLLSVSEKYVIKCLFQRLFTETNKQNPTENKEQTLKEQ